MRVIWRAKALADLKVIHGWLSTIQGALPDRAVLRVRAAADLLSRLGDIGRPSRVDGVRELSVPGAPHVIAYRATDEAFDILAVYHTSQQRQPPDP